MTASLAEVFERAAYAKLAEVKRARAENVGLVQACDDSDLFGFPLWPKQRELLTAIESGTKLHVLAIGRRASKTTMMALVGLWCCLLRPELRERLRPGELGYAVGVATRLDQARVMIKAARSIVTASPLLAPLLVGDTANELRFANDTAFAAFPCSSSGARGWPIFALLIDEFAHFDDTEGPGAADRVWQALSPSTLQFGAAGRVIVSSTPWGSTGTFADMFDRVSDGQFGSATPHHGTSQDFNPTITDAELANERLMYSEEEFASEYLAEFVSVGGAFLSRDDIEAALTGGGEIRPGDAREWVAGIDPAFSRDPFGLALVGQDPARKRLVLGLAKRWLPGDLADNDDSFEGTRRRQDRMLDDVIDVCRRFRARVITDQFMAPQVADRLRRAGLRVEVETMTAASKTDAFVEVRARLAAGELELYPEPQLLDELRRLRSRFSAGRSAVLNPRVGDSHGDMAQSLALAVWGQRKWSVTARPARISIPTALVPPVGVLAGIEEW